MEYSRAIARDYESIKAKAEEMGVPLSWALARRGQYLKDRIEKQEAVVFQTVKQLAGSGELEHRLRMDRIEKAEKVIRYAHFDLGRLKPNAVKGKGVDDTEVERAREYPIQELLPNQLRHSMTLCPFHDDKNPSMHVSGNFAWCFACNRGWNPIDFIMERQGCNFKEAVRYLNEV